MPSLKEVRARISSVTSTSKITSAMKLVSAAKLRRAQDAITSYLPYQQKLQQMLSNFVASSTEELSLPLAQEREVKKAVVLVISSNSSLCGAFNSNVIKSASLAIDGLKKIGAEVEVMALGKKAREAFERRGFDVEVNDDLVDKPSYDKTIDLVNGLIDRYVKKEIDKVVLVYNHFKNAASQDVITDQFLPIVPTKSDDGKKHAVDYILEPTASEVMMQMLPLVVKLHLYGAILDSQAAEHGARTTAMQIATDNASDLIQELTLKYNKARQAAITNELIDIVSGSQGVS